jgi:hypothetical protein
VADHRKALTRLLLSDHGLALEQMQRGYVYIPFDQRLCRLCENCIESPEHALLECRALSQLIRLREVFTQEICQQMPVFLSPQRPHSTLESLKLIIANRATISLVARYTYDVLQLYDDAFACFGIGTIFRNRRSSMGPYCVYLSIYLSIVIKCMSSLSKKTFLGGVKSLI